MALLTLEATGPRGEELALAAGEAEDIPVGFDPEFQCATFDADSFDEEHLKEIVYATLAELHSDWESHLTLVED